VSRCEVELTDSEQRPVTGSWESISEPLGSIKALNFSISWATINLSIKTLQHAI